MSSVTRFLKQIPTDTPYFILSQTQTAVALQIWQPDGNASITSYASGQAAGRFSASTAAVTAGTSLWRDMGKTVVSAGRTFRRIQLLVESGVNAAPLGSGEWTTNAFVPGNEGVVGSASTGSDDSSFGVFYFETGRFGQGLYQPFFRYG